MTQIKIESLRSISATETWRGWPTIARLDHGELIVVCSGGRDAHVCPFGQVQAFRSSDQGATWSEPEILVNGPLDDRDAGLLLTSKGSLLVNWFTSVAWRHLLQNEHQPRSENFNWPLISRCQKVERLMDDALIDRELGTWSIRSTDGGKTWSEKTDSVVGSPHGPTEMPDGRLVYVGQRRADPVREGRNGSPYQFCIGAAESLDDGQTWTWIGEVKFPEELAGGNHEPHAVALPDGRLLVHIRNHGIPGGQILQCESEDGGRTFSTPRTIGLDGLPPHLLCLRDGRILSSYGYRRDPYGIRLSISSDQGRNWSEPIILDEKAEARDLGYPATVELDDGSFYTVWYEALPSNRPVATIEAARWRLQD